MDHRDRILGLARNTDERLFIAQCYDHLNSITNRSRVALSNFLDPGQAALLENVCRMAGGIRARTWGGYSEAERHRALLSAHNNGFSSEDFRVDVLRVVPRDRETPGHRDYLGSLLGLGILREKLGDIVPHAVGAAIFVAQEISPFVVENLTKVGRHPVQVSHMEQDQFIYQPPQLDVKVITAASPRLDALISKAFNLPRSESASLIQQGKVFLNWRQQVSPSEAVSEGDTVSCRGYGRFRVLEYSGLTKKGRERFRLGFAKD